MNLKEPELQRGDAVQTNLVFGGGSDADRPGSLDTAINHRAGRSAVRPALLRLGIALGIAMSLPSCVYDPGVSYYQPAPVYTRPSVTYTAPPPPSTRYYSGTYHSPRYVPPPPPTYSSSYQSSGYRPPASVQFYYSLPRGASYVRVHGNPCWFYNGCYYRRNPRGSGFVLFIP